ncbi:hypothetical protein E8D34_10625 [Nocardioides sp. GY 10113]|uniref:hypothetical protein n=1 Tax=Nocardioides sp. GY 10113 TaxID=2569761 RepID=UPI0010A92D73|nr:hypothetical protein [Nocardioides sp. GY 10113]TIC86699.1 hypothetical protein E8D34_10625 [Nocardioides sp. GY 10113]
MAPGPDNDVPQPTVESAPGDDEQAGEHSEEQRARANDRFRDAEAALLAAHDDAIDKLLAPFAEAFRAIHDVRLGDVPTVDAVPELGEVDADVRVAALDVVDALVKAGGVATNVAYALGSLRHLPAGVNRALQSRATKQTIKALRGVRGQLLANKGLVAGSLLAAGSVALLLWSTRDDSTEQRKQQVSELAAAQDELLKQLATDQTQFAARRYEDAAQVLTRLTDLGIGRLPAFRALVQSNNSYETYAADERAIVAELVGLAQIVAAVIATSRMTTEGEFEPHSPQTLDAAKAAAAARSTPRTGATVTDIAAWEIARVATERERQQLGYLLEQPDLIRRMQARFSNRTIAQQRGHYFEWKHELSFNLNAMAEGSDIRLRMTEWLGRPTDPADLVLHDGAGNVIGEAQAKVLSTNVQRMSSNGLPNDKYGHMQLLVPEDHRVETADFLERRLEMPRGLFHDRYESVQERLTDRITAGDVASDPVSTTRLADITDDPLSYVNGLFGDTQFRQAVGAAVSAGGSAALVTIATDTARHVLEHGTFDGLSWTDATIRTARAGAASAATAAAGSIIQSTAQKAVADGATNPFRRVLAESDLGVAMAKASLDVAVVAHGLATGRLTAAEAALAATETVTESVAVWACAAVGRKVIPNQAVGALVGGIVGQYAAAIIVRGVRLALVGRDPAQEWDAAYDALIQETAELEVRCADERAELGRLAEQYRIGFTEHVLPALDRLTHDADGEDPDARLRDLAAIATQYAGAPIFGSQDEFDAFMADPSTTLVLDIGKEIAP